MSRYKYLSIIFLLIICSFFLKAQIGLHDQCVISPVDNSQDCNDRFVHFKCSTAGYRGVNQHSAAANSSISRQRLANIPLNHFAYYLFDYVGALVVDINYFEPNLAQLSDIQQEHILCLHDYYWIGTFQEIISTLPNYRPYIKNLYKRYKQRTFLDRTFGCNIPDNTPELYNEVIRQEKEEQQVENQRLVALAAHQRKQKKEREKRYAYLQKKQIDQQNSFVQLIDEYQEQLYDFDDGEDDFGYNPLHKKRLEKRYQALQKSCDNNFSISKKEFSLTSNAYRVINRFSLDKQSFATCEGSNYQHAIHAELISMLDSLGSKYNIIQANSNLSSLAENTISMISLAQEANSSAFTEFATKATDLCWALLDCAIGVVGGIGDGIVNTVHTFTHPIESIKNLYSSIKTAGYHVALFLKELEEINVAMEMGEYEVALEKNEELSDRIYHNITAVYTIIKETPPRDLARVATAFVTEGYLTGKGLHACGQFFSKAKNTALPKLQKVKDAAIAHYKDLTQVPVHEFKLALAGEAPEVLLAHETVESLHNLQEVEQTISNFSEAALKGGSNYAHNANAQIALEKKLSALEKARKKAVKIRKMSDGRIRYYNVERHAKTLGKTRGSAHVTEFNTNTGQIRAWSECYDHSGKVIRVHPKMIDGRVVTGQHYPPTKSEIASFLKK